MTRPANMTNNPDAPDAADATVNRPRLFDAAQVTP